MLSGGHIVAFLRISFGGYYENTKFTAYLYENYTKLLKKFRINVCRINNILYNTVCRFRMSTTKYAFFGVVLFLILLLTFIKPHPIIWTEYYP